MEKQCETCKEVKPLTEFYFRKERNKYRDNCKKCKPLISKKDISDKANAETKVCKHCGIEKKSSEYQKSGKWLQPYCKPCDAERKKKHCLKNRDKISQKSKKYCQDNKDIIAENKKLYYLKNTEKIKGRRTIYKKVNSDKIKESNKKYKNKNSELLKEKRKQEYLKNRESYLAKFKIYRDNRTEEDLAIKKQYNKEYKIKNKENHNKWKQENIESIRKSKREAQKRSMIDPNYRLIKNFRSRIRIALKGILKTDTSINILGCDIEFFKKYIELQFKEGMNWDNYGINGWHIDHKIPVSWFNLSNPNCLKLAFNYKNHQPLSWQDNLAKSNKYHHKIN